MYSVIKLEPGLQIELASGRTTYRARAHVNGAVGYSSMQTGDADEAAAKARVWFASWRRTLDPRTMAVAAVHHANLYSAARASAKADFLKRWAAIARVCELRKKDVTDIDTAFLRAFLVARGAITGNTAKKDLDTIRPILRTAKELGWIASLPDFPKATVLRNPRLPFTAAEWRTLREVCTDQDVSDFMHVVVLGLLRPHEVLRLTTRDVAERNGRLWIHVRRKTGIAHAPVPVRFTSLRVILARKVRYAQECGDSRIFPHSANWFPHAFGKLLDAHDLRQPLGSACRPRDSWSLRATGICLEIKRQRRKRGAADYLQIARWAGTSMSRIDGHYAAFLG